MTTRMLVLTACLSLCFSAVILPSADADSPVADSPSKSGRPMIAIMIGEAEYETSETLPQFAERFLQSDYRIEYVLEDPSSENGFLNIPKLADADLLLLSVRRKTLPTEQLQMVRNFIAAGKPVVGIRTASHAFCLRGKPAPEGCDQWLQFDAEVFGGNYTNHYSRKKTSTLTRSETAKNHPILTGISLSSFTQTGSLYKTSPLADGATPLLMGRVDGEDAEPVAWTFQRADGGRSFYTSLGHRTDFSNAVFQNLLRQGIDWALSGAPQKASGVR